MPRKATAKKKTTRAAAKKSATKRSSNKTKLVYAFGKKTDGNGKMKPLLGGKGANLAEMARIGLPVPPGFTITTEVCIQYYKNRNTYPKGLEKEINDALSEVEKQTGKKFGDPKDPLLFSVRSGARDSMPGMMDTILNLGLNDETVKGLAEKSGSPRFAYDCYRRFIQMYGDVVMGVQPEDEHAHEPFDEVMSDMKDEAGISSDTELTTDNLIELVKRYKALIKRITGGAFPQDVHKQLDGAIGAVFQSWNNERAVVYRRKYNIPHEWGTAVNVQAMVFGNMGDTSATGVAFTRDPASGEKVFYGEYLINAQGEDVVAGTRTPKPIAQLAVEMPKAHKELEAVRGRLERHFRDLQDFEFTVEDGTLYMLQTRNGKRTGLAAVRIAVEMVNERLINWKTALTRIPAESISTLLVPIFDPEGRKKVRVIATGLPAGPGAASGKVVFSAQEAVRQTAKGEQVILCRTETSPEDIRGMLASEGILTSRGGVSSHAALVARQMGKVCICGASDIVVDYRKRQMRVGSLTIAEFDDISIDGTTGEVYAGYVPTAPSEVNQVLSGKLKAKNSYTYQIFDQVMQWADKVRRLGIRTNADSPTQATQAIALGAAGIGLCRTEHMFFDGDRIIAMREMILAETEKARKTALAKLLPYQRKDFTGIFKAMKGYPVTIRLLDPPLHEFLPHDDTSIRGLAAKLDVPQEKIVERVKALHEQNPMLGHRGCRLGIAYPEITEMQARAIFEAAANLLKAKNPIPVEPEIMVPLVGFPGELENQVAIIHRVAKEVMEKKSVNIKYLVGTMIEVPRAAIVADEIADTAEFFSFGTNDLTQTTLGMSRDDTAAFLPLYQEMDIVPQNPFATVDAKGVGGLMKIAVENGRATRKNIKLGICGEHGGDPDSIHFCHEIGLNYVSCSPTRVPIARLAAAQAALA